MSWTYDIKTKTLTAGDWLHVVELEPWQLLDALRRFQLYIWE